MRVIGLTGGIGAGKSAVAERFVALGAGLVDTDQIAHQLTAAGGEAITPLVAAFGADSLTTSGALDRVAMRARAFRDPETRKRLERILHPLIGAAASQALAAQHLKPYCLLAVPLLFEGLTYQNLLASTLLVDCPIALQIERVAARPRLNAADAERIIAAQLPRAVRLQMADDVICNHGTLAALDAPIGRLHARYTSPL